MKERPLLDAQAGHKGFSFIKAYVDASLKSINLWRFLDGVCGELERWKKQNMLVEGSECEINIWAALYMKHFERNSRNRPAEDIDRCKREIASVCVCVCENYETSIKLKRKPERPVVGFSMK